MTALIIPVMKKLMALMAATLLVACSPKITSNIVSSCQALPSDAEVALLEVYEEAPENAEVLASISIGDTGFTATKNGTYEAVVALAKQQARNAGGNVVKLTEHKIPDGWSTVHRIKADILRVDDLSALHNDSDADTSAHPDYAVIHFWRFGGVGVAVTYDVYVGETKVFRSVPGSKAEVKVYDEGRYEIWAKTESKTSLTIDLRKGGDYYISTGVTLGAFVGRPSLEFVQESSGRSVYNSIKD